MDGDLIVRHYVPLPFRGPEHTDTLLMPIVPMNRTLSMSDLAFDSIQHELSSRNGAGGLG